MTSKIEVAYGFLSYIMIQVPELPVAQAITDTSSWDVIWRQAVAMAVAMVITIASRFAYEWISKKFKSNKKNEG